MGRGFIPIAGDGVALQVEMAADQRAHAFVGDPVCRMDDGRLEAACDFVFATRARLEAREAFAQTVGDALIETQLEMQAVDGDAGAPVTAVERLVIAEAQRQRDGARRRQGRGR